jgi:putative Holliday junction resolvase
MVPCGDQGAPTVRPGTRLGVDVGDVRIGVARCDPAASIATPVETIAAGPNAIPRLLDLAAEYSAVEVVVGLPRSLSGRLGPAAAKVDAFATALSEGAHERGMSIPVRLVDERLTTVSAERLLRERGRKGARRRAVVDQAAAVVILQHAIDTERSTGRPPGQEVGHPT